jgi:hypothetical protein
MKSLADLLTAWKAHLEGDADLAGFAAEMARDVPGTSGRMEVRLGNEFTRKLVPPSLYPFVLLTLGSEKERRDTLSAVKVRREVRLHGGISDPDTERGTLRAVAFEELLADVAWRFLAGQVYDPERNPGGLILGFEVRPLLSDQDLNRPAVLRTLPVEVSYVLE